MLFSELLIERRSRVASRKWVNHLAGRLSQEITERLLVILRSPDEILSTLGPQKLLEDSVMLFMNLLLETPEATPEESSEAQIPRSVSQNNSPSNHDRVRTCQSLALATTVFGTLFAHASISCLLLSTTLASGRAASKYYAKIAPSMSVTAIQSHKSFNRLITALTSNRKRDVRLETLSCIRLL